MAVYTITLRSVGNPDFAQYAPVSEPRKVAAGKLSEIRKACRDYIEEWDLGGGNWPDCPVRRDGKVVGYFSYNGRFWRTRRVTAASLQSRSARPSAIVIGAALFTYCDDPLETLPPEDCRDRLRRIREILWPEEDPEESWSPDHLDLVGQLIDDLRLPTVPCTLCSSEVHLRQAHHHSMGWIGPCCWDERLRATE